MAAEKIVIERYSKRAADFIRSAAILCEDIHDGWVPSSCLLLGNACELLAKRRLLIGGKSEKILKSSPYGHDISELWRRHTRLYEETENLVSELKKDPNPHGVDIHFDWGLHFDQLAKGHSAIGDYSIRYHKGEKNFADPKAMTVILGNIWKTEKAQWG